MYISQILPIITILAKGALLFEDVCERNETAVDCRNKNLTEIPTLTGLPETVTHLDFSFNNIIRVDSISIPFPSSISSISFSHNYIDTVVKGVFDNIGQLRELDLSFNKIDGQALQNEDLDLDIGSSVWLNLRGNNIGTIKANTLSPFGFSKLVHLDLSQCLLKTIDEFSIMNLGDLKYLNLSYNLLTQFEDVLPGDINLEKLDLSFNKIAIVRKLPPLLSLKYLYLDNNGIVAIKNGVFSSLLRLRVLSLVGNNLKTLNVHTLPIDSIHSDLEQIRLDKNPWRCDCNLKWLLTKPNEESTMLKNFTLRCSYPSRLRGKNLFDVSTKDLTCPSEYSKLTYILIMFFTTCFMVAAIGYLIYFKRKKFPCFEKKGGNYVAVYTNTNVNEDDGEYVKITTKDDETLVDNEEVTVFRNNRVQYFDV